MPDKELLHRLADRLPDPEVLAALRYVEFLLSKEAPLDPEMLARIDAARRDPSPGISHDDLLPDREGLYRLRVGKWRLFFDLDAPDTVRIHGIDNRGEAY